MNNQQLSRFALGLAVGLMSFFTRPASAQLECPTSETGLGLPVVAVIPLTQAVPEQVSRDGKAQGVFLTGEVSLTFAASGQRVFLSADTCGNAPLRTDDYAELTVSPGDGQWSQDFRNPARTMIESRAVTEISDLLLPGDNRLSLSLIDLTGPAYSSTAYFIIVAADPSYTAKTPPPTRVTATPTVSATATVEPSPTATSQPVAVAVIDTPEPKEKPGWGWGPLLGVILAVGLAAAALWQRSTGLRPPGELDIEQNGRYLKTITLAQIGKVLLTVGSKGDLVLSGEDVPEIGAHIRAQRHPQQGVQALIEFVDPAQPKVVLEAYPLADSDVHYLGSYKLTYRRTLVEPTFLEGDITNA